MSDDDRTVIAPSSAPFGPPQPAPDAGPAAENDRNALPPGARVFEFEIQRVIGIGGFGIVYLAYDHSLQRNIALKEYMPSSLAERTGLSHVAIKSARHASTFEAGMRSFINEARLLAQFDHPSLLKVYRFWEANGTAYMVMPFYDGLTLKQHLQTRETPPDESWLKALLAPLLDALETMHRGHCFHRDIAPDNILMLEDGRPLLLDFGAARRAITGIDQAFTVILKPGYAPIEQYADMASVPQGPWTDIYALASVVHYAITGRAPVASVSRVLSDKQVPLTQSAATRYSEAFLQTIDRCLAVQPQDRPQSVALLRAQLRLASDLKAPPARNHTLPDAEKSVSEPKAAPRDKRLTFGLIGGALMIALSASAFLMTRAPSSPGLSPDAAKPVPKSLSHVAPPVAAPTPEPSAPSVSPPEASHVVPLPRSEPEAPGTKTTDALAALKQIYDARDPDHLVQVSLVKRQVRIGVDRLQMRLTSAKPGYVYLLMVGTNRSDFTLLFPNVADRQNRINAGKAIALPRAGWKLGAVGPPGVDEFVVMVSDRPRTFGNVGLRQGELFAEFPPDLLAQAPPKGAAGLPAFAGIPECGQESRAACPANYGAAEFSIVEVPAR